MTTRTVLLPELVDAVYTGKVVSTHDGYCFIRDITQGYATVATDGDVFCPQPHPTGATVEFHKLDDDPARAGKFRTESAIVIATPEGLITTDRSAMQLMRAEQILALSRMRTSFHAHSKPIDPQEALKAAKNGPFADMARFTPDSENVDIVQSAEEFLRAQFPTLAEMGFSCSLTEEEGEEEKEQKILAHAKSAYTAAGVTGQVDALGQEFRQFYGVRSVFRAMKRTNTLKLDSVIPISYLPDLLMTAPVWYFNGWDHVQFFCNRVRSQEFATLFQLYNAGERNLGDFRGREVGGKYLTDTMPPDVAMLIAEMTGKFDYVVIATPYHDIASSEWSDPNWRRNVDPYLFGFQRSLDYMFLLRRWSGTGLYPRMCDMIADTVAHLAFNRERLANLNGDIDFYDPKTQRFNALDSSRGNGNKVLAPFVDKITAAFERGELFPFLRGEVKEETA